MFKCKTCNVEVFFYNTENTDNRCIGIKSEDSVYCIPCHEVLIFMSDSKPRKK